MWLVSTDGAEAEPLLETGSSAVRWSQDSNRVFFVAGGNVAFVSLDDRAEHPITDLKGRRGTLRDFDVHEGYLYFSWSEHLGDLWVMDVVQE